MKPVTTVILILLASSTVAGAFCWAALTGGDDGTDLTARQDLESRLSTAQDRLAEMQLEIDELRDETKRLHESEAALAARTARRDDLQDLAARVDALLSGNVGIDTAGAGSALNRAKALEAFVDEAVAKRMKKSKQSPLRQFEPFVRAGLQRQLGRASRKLKLNEEQKKRFQESVNVAFDRAMPAVSVMLDPSQPENERTAAYEEVKGSFAQVRDDAESYMDSEQKQEFDKIQEEQEKGIDRLRNMFNGGMPGMPPVPPPAPPKTKNL